MATATGAPCAYVHEKDATMTTERPSMLRSCKRFLRMLLIYTQACGINPINILKRCKNLPRFCREYRAFVASAAQMNVTTPIAANYPVLTDYDDGAGVTKGHYFHQDLWAARKIYTAAPARHIDIGSRIDGFVAHLLTFRSVEIIDIRPMVSQIEGLSFIQADATNLQHIDDNSLASVSALHAAEHFGLGRYGDPIDALGHIKFMQTLARVLQPGGRLYFSMPIGRECVMFNAHRITAPATILKAFADLELVSFSAVDDAGDFVKDAAPDDFATANYACGLFEFTKRTA